MTTTDPEPRCRDNRCSVKQLGAMKAAKKALKALQQVRGGQRHGEEKNAKERSFKREGGRQGGGGVRQ